MPATPKPIATARSTSSDSATSESSAGTTANTVNAASVQVEKKPFQSRFLQTQPAAPAQQQPTKPQEEESEESSEEEEEETSEESEEEEDEEPTPTPAPKPTPTHTPVTRPEPVAVTSTRAPERKDSREETSTRPAYSWRTQQPSGSFERDESPKYGRVRSSATSAAVADPPEDRYSRYVTKLSCVRIIIIYSVNLTRLNIFLIPPPLLFEKKIIKQKVIKLVVDFVFKKFIYTKTNKQTEIVID